MLSKINIKPRLFNFSKSPIILPRRSFIHSNKFNNSIIYRYFFKTNENNISTDNDFLKKLSVDNIFEHYYKVSNLKPYINVGEISFSSFICAIYFGICARFSGDINYEFLILTPLFISGFALYGIKNHKNYFANDGDRLVFVVTNYLKNNSLTKYNCVLLDYDILATLLKIGMENFRFTLSVKQYFQSVKDKIYSYTLLCDRYESLFSEKMDEEDFLNYIKV